MHWKLDSTEVCSSQQFDKNQENYKNYNKLYAKFTPILSDIRIRMNQNKKGEQKHFHPLKEIWWMIQQVISFGS